MPTCPLHLATGHRFLAFAPEEQWGRYKILGVDDEGAAIVEKLP